jgi:hypothetical protein
MAIRLLPANLRSPRDGRGGTARARHQHHVGGIFWAACRGRGDRAMMIALGPRLAAQRALRTGGTISGAACLEPRHLLLER